ERRYDGVHGRDLCHRRAGRTHLDGGKPAACNRRSVGMLVSVRRLVRESEKIRDAVRLRNGAGPLSRRLATARRGRFRGARRRTGGAVYGLYSAGGSVFESRREE